MFLSAALPHLGADTPVPSLNALRTGAESLWRALGPHPPLLHRADPGVLLILPLAGCRAGSNPFTFLNMFSISSVSPYLRLALLLSLLGEPSGRVGDTFAAGGRGRSAGLRREGGRERGDVPAGAGCRGSALGNGPPRLFPPRVGAGFFVAVKPFPSPAFGVLADKGAHAGPPPTVWVQGGWCVQLHADSPCHPTHACSASVGVFACEGFRVRFCV